jgi:CBS domain-containing protein
MLILGEGAVKPIDSREQESEIMKARDLMTKDPQVVTVNQRVSDAARIMRDQGVGCVPVVDATSTMRVKGVITDRDIAVRCAAERHVDDCPVIEHMTAGPLDTVGPDSDVEDVMELMELDRVRRILVTEGDRLIGIIAQADLALKEGPLEPLKVEQVLERVSAPSVPLP